MQNGRREGAAGVGAESEGGKRGTENRGQMKIGLERAQPACNEEEDGERGPQSGRKMKIGLERTEQRCNKEEDGNSEARTFERDEDSARKGKPRVRRRRR